ncbi:hypothetical protein 3S13_1 [uncultured Caudovirales phage]|uniref:Uncharacterized protein n=1 Tax=uncultured Caudovirales phage TaxID=2100421 RepID=A0A2H4JHN7_9CAUD|nr:hypothetical protein 3S13_1 [uncultured Caudovirales phage]
MDLCSQSHLPVLDPRRQVVVRLDLLIQQHFPARPGQCLLAAGLTPFPGHAIHRQGGPAQQRFLRWNTLRNDHTELHGIHGQILGARVAFGVRLAGAVLDDECHASTRWNGLKMAAGSPTASSITPWSARRRAFPGTLSRRWPDTGPWLHRALLSAQRFRQLHQAVV